jgi:hypothetical protein
MPVLEMVDAVAVRMASLELGEAGSAWGRPSVVWRGVQRQNDGIAAWANRYPNDVATLDDLFQAESTTCRQPSDFWHGGGSCPRGPIAAVNPTTGSLPGSSKIRQESTGVREGNGQAKPWLNGLARPSRMLARIDRQPWRDGKMWLGDKGDQVGPAIFRENENPVFTACSQTQFFLRVYKAVYKNFSAREYTNKKVLSSFYLGLCEWSRRGSNS